MRRSAWGWASFLSAAFAAMAVAAPPNNAGRVASAFRLLGAGPSVAAVEALGTLGGCCSWASGINANGDVVGSAADDMFRIQPFLWTATDGMQALDPSAFESYAMDVNDDRVVVGWHRLATGETRGWVWRPGGVVRELVPLGGASTLAFGVNNRGDIVGASQLVAGGPLVAVVWYADGTTRVLGTLHGVGASAGKEIGESGHVAGLSWNAQEGDFHAFLWTPDGGMRDLGHLGGGYSAASGVNGSDWVAGESNLSSGELRAVLWLGSAGWVELEPVAGANSAASDVEADGRVVGWSDAPGPLRAVVWGPNDLRIELGSVAGGEFDMGVAAAINRVGQVAGYSTGPSGMPVATRWTLESSAPPPPPPPPPPPTEGCAAKTSAERLDCLANQVVRLRDAGVLNPGQANSLLVKIRAAKRQVERANERTARNILRAFVNQVHAFVHAEIVSRTEGTGLIAAASGALDD